MFNHRTALVDVGSNTMRLVIFEIDHHYNVNEIQNIKVPARLAHYVEEEGMVKEGIDILVSVLANFQKIVKRFNTQEEFVVATAAVRQSKNINEILERVSEETNFEMRILEGDEEAYYGNYAVRHSMEIRDALSIDIGGGSTELVLFKNKKVEKGISLSFGGVSLSEHFFDGVDHCSKKEIKKARQWIRGEIESVEWVSNLELPLIGIGGSIRNIAEVYQRMTNYPIAGMHEYVMEKSQLEEVLDFFCTLSSDEMEEVDGLSAERKDTIIPALIVFLELMEVMEAKHLIVSQKGLREGIIMEYLNNDYSKPYELNNVSSQAVSRVARKYKVSSFSVNQRIVIIDLLLTELEKINLIELSQEELDWLYYGAVLYFLGSYIENDAKSQHTFYILTNMNLNGFDHRSRVAMGLIASFKNKSLFKQYVLDFEDWFSEEELEKLLCMGSLVKFGEALNDAQVNKVLGLNLEKIDESNYQMNLKYKDDVISESYRAEKQKNHFERILNADLTLIFE